MWDLSETIQVGSCLGKEDISAVLSEREERHRKKSSARNSLELAHDQYSHAAAVHAVHPFLLRQGGYILSLSFPHSHLLKNPSAAPKRHSKAATRRITSHKSQIRHFATKNKNKNDKTQTVAVQILRQNQSATDHQVASPYERATRGGSERKLKLVYLWELHTCRGSLCSS